MKLVFNSASAQWLVPALIALGSLIGTGAIAYSKTNARITALETHQTDDQQHLEHIDTQVDRLVEWALGHK